MRRKKATDVSAGAELSFLPQQDWSNDPSARAAWIFPNCCVPPRDFADDSHKRIFHRAASVADRTQVTPGCDLRRRLLREMTAKSSRTWGIWPMGGFVAIGSRSDKSLKTQEYPDYEFLENNVPL